MLAAVGLAIVAGCGRGGPKAPPTPRVVVVVAPGVNPVWGRSLGGITSALESRAGVIPSARVVRSPERVEEALMGAAEGGAKLAICLGPECSTAVFTVAPAYPTVRFVVAPGERPDRNVAAVTFAQNEAAYIAGAVAPALDDAPRVVAVDTAGCGDSVLTAFRNSLRVRTPSTKVEEIGREDVISGEGFPSGTTMALVCPGPRGADIVARAGALGIFVVVFDPALVQGTAGLRCGVIEEDLPEALVRVTTDLLERHEPGMVYSFDVGSGVVRFRVCGKNDESLPPGVLQAVSDARDEVVAGIAEIEILDMKQ